MTPKYFAVVDNRNESRRDYPLRATEQEEAMQEAQKYKGHLLVGGSVHVIENGVGEVGAFGRDVQP